MDKIKKFLNDLKAFESEFEIIKKRKDSADKIMEIPGYWNMVPRKAGEFYLDSLNRCISFLESVVATFENFQESEIEEEIEELPKRKIKEEIKEVKKEEIKKEDTEERCEEVKEMLIEQGNKNKKIYSIPILLAWTNNPRKQEYRIHKEENRKKIAKEVNETLKKIIEINDSEQISENNSISGSIGDGGVKDA